MTTSLVCPILVGREAELRTLSNAREEGGGTVVVTGEAGIGKSRLLRAFAEQLAGRSAVVWGRPEIVSEPGPYSLLIDLLDEISVSHSDGNEARELLALVTSNTPGREALSARQIAARTRGLIGNLGNQPVVIVEDLHAADEPSQAVVAHLARSARDDGTLIVAALRSDERPTAGTARLLDLLHRDRLASWIELSALGRDAVKSMLSSMWGEEPSEQELAFIWAQGEGVPFFTEELGAARSEGIQVPRAVAAGIAARLQRLTPHARRVLEAASLSHGAIEPSSIAAAAGVSESMMPQLLMEGIHAGLLADRDGRIVFRHALLRDAVASTLVSVQRRALHRELAVAIERLSQGDDRQSFALAHHYREAGDSEHAAQWFVRAGRKALSSGTVEEAEELFKQALFLLAEGSARAEACRGLAEVSLRVHDHTKAMDFLTEAAREWSSGGAREQAAEALSEKARLLAAAGDPQAFELMDQALQLVGAGSPRSRLLFQSAQVQALIRSEIFARDAVENALKAAERDADPELIALCSLELARISRLDGRQDEAKRHADQARTTVIDHGLDHLVGRTFGMEASLAAQEGRNTEALTLLDEGRLRLIEGLSSHHIISLDSTRVGVLWQMGRPEEADRVAKRMQVGRLAQGYGRAISVWAALEAGDEAYARAYVDAWWEKVGSRYRDLPSEQIRELPESPEGGQFAQLADAVIAAYSDAPTATDLDRAQRYWELCRGAVRDVRVLSTLFLMRCLVTRRELDELEALILDAQSHAISLYHQALLLEVRGNMALCLDQAEEAESFFNAAEAKFRNIDNASDRARVLIALAAAGPQGAKENLREALNLASGSGAHRYARKAEAVLRNLGVRPRAGRPKGSARKEGLSSREEEVVTLVATGATNAEIAGRLFLSERTVQDHLARASRRLGVSGRAGLAAWAAKQGLI